MRQKMANEAENVLLTLPDVKKVSINFGQMTEDERKKMFSSVRPVMVEVQEFNQVKNLIAVLSGKGGLGKIFHDRAFGLRAAPQQANA